MNPSATSYVEIIKIDEKVSTDEISACGYEIIIQQTNETKKYVSYRYIVNIDPAASSVGSDVCDQVEFDSANEDDIIYFEVDGQPFHFDGVSLPPGGSMTVKFLIPCECIPGTGSATVTTITRDGSTEDNFTITVRTGTTKTLKIERDLAILPLPTCCDGNELAATAYRFNIDAPNYNAYRFENSALTLLNSDAEINDRDTIVYINKNLTIDLFVVLEELSAKPDILPNRVT